MPYSSSNSADSSITINNSNSQQNAFPILNRSFINQLNLIALTLMTASVLYLMASNWFEIAPLFRMLIPMGLLLLVAGISTMDRWSAVIRSALHTICGMMIGLTFASIGQVYQTGADGYQLFLLWAIVLTPWLIWQLFPDLLSYLSSNKAKQQQQETQASTGVFVLWAVVTQLALGLYFKQTFLLEDYTFVYLLAMLALTLIQMHLSYRLYPASRYLMVFWVACVSIVSSMVLNQGYNYSDDIAKNISLLLTMLVPIGVTIGYFYKKNQQLPTVLSVTGLSFAVLIWVLDVLDDVIGYGMMRWLASAVVVFAEFALLAYLFSKVFKNSNHHQILLAIGAWVAGLFFSTFILVAWDTFSIVAGIGCMLGGIALINKNHAFTRHLGYCLAIAGQTAVLTHSGIESESIYPLLPIHLLCFFVLMKFINRPHWLILTLQLLAFYLLVNGAVVEFFDYNVFSNLNDPRLLSSLLISSMLISFVYYGLIMLVNWTKLTNVDSTKVSDQLSETTSNTVNNSLIRGLITSVLLVIVFSLVVHPFFRQVFRQEFYEALVDVENPMTISKITQSVDIAYYLFSAVWFAIFAYLFGRHLPKVLLICLSILAGVLAYFGYFEIFILLMIMAWSIGNDKYVSKVKKQTDKKDKLMFAFTMMVFAFALWQLYYHLHISFLYKALSIFISGLLVFALAKVLGKFVPLQSN